MIATGTDVKPLNVSFMRDVKSRYYFEQMKGRGTRTIPLDDLKKVTPSARYVKDHFVIVDAIGVTKSLEDRQPSFWKRSLSAAKGPVGRRGCGVQGMQTFTSLATASPGATTHGQ